MTNFAIFNYSGIGKNQGGPTGYLYNLYEGLKDNGLDIPLYYINQNANISKNTSNKLLHPFIEEIRSFFYYIKKGIICSKKVNQNIHNHEIIHVHNSEDVFYLRKFVKYKGKILMTPHRPQSLYEEVITKMKLKFKTKWKFPLLKLFMIYIEKYGYKNSDGYIFPSKGAMSIYNEFPGFTMYSTNKPLGYVYTGVSKQIPNISNNDYRKELKISATDKMICYIGRHNYVKGYDLLANLANRFERDNIKVVCAGANDLLPSPNKPNWIELGHIKDPYNLINASDIVVIPNRNTYFDLIIIEILSLGKIVVTSNTGGNLDIAKLTNGVILFNSGDIESLYHSINKALNLSNEEKEKYMNENIMFYNKFCNLDKFASNYISTINKITIELKN